MDMRGRFIWAKLIFIAMVIVPLNSLWVMDTGVVGHGVNFTRHLRTFATADPDPLVRELARAYYRASLSGSAGKPRIRPPKAADK